MFLSKLAEAENIIMSFCKGEADTHKYVTKKK